MSDGKEIKRLQAELAALRNFPTNTTPASRHLELMADALAAGGRYAMFEEEPKHCAITIYSVLVGFYTRASASAASPEREEPVAWRVVRGARIVVGMVTADPSVRDAWLEAEQVVEPLFATPSPAMKAGSLLSPEDQKALDDVLIEHLRAQLTTARKALEDIANLYEGSHGYRAKELANAVLTNSSGS